MAVAAAHPWQAFAGKWKIARSENVEAYMKEMNLNPILRKLATTVKPAVTIEVQDDKITFTVKFGLKKMVHNFHVNGPETDCTFEDKTVKARSTWEDGKLIVVTSGTADGEVKPQKVIREIVNGELVQAMECNKVKCTRWMTRKEDKKAGDKKKKEDKKKEDKKKEEKK